MGKPKEVSDPIVEVDPMAEIPKETIEPEKEVVMIIISKSIKEAVLKAIYEKVGLDTPGQGIAFTLPVDDVVGINKNI